MGLIRTYVGATRNLYPDREMEGKRFGWLTILKFSHVKIHKFYLCVCDCGNKRVCSGNNLRTGRIRKCRTCSLSLRAQRLTTHGGCYYSTYESWECMNSRCFNPNNNNFHNYGGRGITVCDRWRVFKNFYEDMGQRPKGLDLGRIDINKGYCKENCAWRTHKETNGNRRKAPQRCNANPSEQISTTFLPDTHP